MSLSKKLVDNMDYLTSYIQNPGKLNLGKKANNSYKKTNQVIILF